MTAPVLSSRGVVKAFGSQTVLAGVDLEVAGPTRQDSIGEIVGFVGPNGAGKSTWLRCVVGLTHRTAGDLTVLGHDPGRDPLAVRGLVSYLPGETSVYENMRGREFVDFALGFYPRHQADVVATLEQAFELPMHRKVRTYSAGMKQKLALVAALGPDVPLYLLDEPDRALDASTRMLMRDVLLDLRNRGKCVLLSSHHLSEVKLLADRTEFLVAGTIVPTTTIQAIEDGLQRRVWLRLDPAADEPSGCRALRREPDGTTLYEVEGEPLDWLRRIPQGQIHAAEIGLTRLEDLYRELGARTATVAASAREEPQC